MGLGKVNLDIDKIENVIREVELSTSGEILPIIAASSSKYEFVCLKFAIGCALIGNYLFFKLSLFETFGWYFVSLGLSILMIYFLLCLTSLKKFIISKQMINSEVSEASYKYFYFHNLHETKDSTGILIYISLLERQVRILADKGINATVKPGTWDKVVENLILHLSNKNLTAGLETAIKECGNILSVHFPRKPDDENEISNRALIIL